MSMTNGLDCISVRVCRVNENEENLLEGSGTLFEDNGNYYVLTAYHCLEKKLKNGFVEENLDLTRVFVRYQRMVTRVEILGFVDKNKTQDWALLNVERPAIEWNYEGKLKLTTDVIVGEVYESYPFISVYGEKGCYLTVTARNVDGDCHLNDDMSTGRFSADTVMQGGSGAGVMKCVDGVLYCFGFMRKTLPHGMLNDVSTVCVDSIIPLLSKGVEKRFDAKEIETERHQRIASYAEQLVQLQGSDDLKTVVEQLLDETIPALIDTLQDGQAGKLINLIEKNCGKLLDENRTLRAQYHYDLSQFHRLIQNTDEARKFAHLAFEEDSSNQRYIATEIRRLWACGNKEDARQLVAQLSEENLVRRAVEVFCTEDQKGAFEALPAELKNSQLFRYNLLDLFNRGYGYPGWIVEGIEIKEPDSLLLSTLPEWVFFFTQIHFHLQGVIPLTKDYPVNSKLLKKGLDAGWRYFSLARGTKIEKAIPILSSLYFYWGFLLGKDWRWFDEFEKVSIEGENAVNRRYYAVMKSSMLSINGQFNEAYKNIVEQGLTPDSILWAMAAGIACLTQKDSYLYDFASYAEQHKAVVDSQISEVLVQIAERMEMDVVLRFLEKLPFQNNNERRLLCDYSRLIHGNKVSTTGYEEFIHQLTGILPSVAAKVIFNSGEKDYALEYLKSKFTYGEGSGNERTYFFLLSLDPTRQSEYYQHLENKRKSGEEMSQIELRQEYNYTLRLQDFAKALEIIEIILKDNQDDEFAFAAYIDLIGRCRKEELHAWYEKTIDFEFNHISSIQNVYLAYASNGYVEEAAEILYAHTLRLEDDGLNAYYLDETLKGFIARISNKSYDDVTEDNYVVYTINDVHRTCRKLSANTILGAALMDRKRGETVEVELSGEIKHIHIEAIYNKFGYLHYDILKSVIEQGGNDYLHPLKVPESKGVEGAKELIKTIENLNKEEWEKYQKALADYHRGDNGLCMIARSDDLLSSYYYFLFSKFELNVKPHELYLYAKGYMRHQKPSYVLDITSMLLLFEFKLISGIDRYKGRLLMPRMIYNVVEAFQKSLPVLTNLEFFKAMEEGHIYRFSENPRTNIEMRIQSLKEWIEKDCEIVTSPMVLNVNGPNGMNGNVMLLQHTIVELINAGVPRMLLTEDYYLERLMKIKLPIASTETYMYEMEGIDIGKAFTEFLHKNNCRYVDLRLL